MDRTELLQQIEEITDRACSDLSTDDFWIFMKRIREMTEDYE